MFAVGDNVLVYRASYDNNPVIGTVGRLTKTQVILKDGSRYRREGSMPGGYAGAGYIMPATPEQVEIIRRSERATRLRAFLIRRVNEMSLEDLEALYTSLCKPPA